MTRLCKCGCGGEVTSKNPRVVCIFGHRTKKPLGVIKARFEKFVDKTTGDCWLWTGYTESNGYGRINVNGKRYSVHRLAWELHNKSVPAGLSVLHSCDHPACVNPAHLFLGTHADNMADKKAKGRQFKTKGVLNGRHYLTDDAVRMMRAGRAEGNTMRELAARFGVSLRTVSDVLSGRTWRHLLDT